MIFFPIKLQTFSIMLIKKGALFWTYPNHNSHTSHPPMIRLTLPLDSKIWNNKSLNYEYNVWSAGILFHPHFVATKPLLILPSRAVQCIFAKETDEEIFCEIYVHLINLVPFCILGILLQCFCQQSPLYFLFHILFQILFSSSCLFIYFMRSC